MLGNLGTREFAYTFLLVIFFCLFSFFVSFLYGHVLEWVQCYMVWICGW